MLLQQLSDQSVQRGVSDHIRSDIRPEFISQVLRDWQKWVRVKTLFIEPGSPWENGHNDVSIERLWDELLNGEILYTPSLAYETDLHRLSVKYFTDAVRADC